MPNSKERVHVGTYWTSLLVTKITNDSVYFILLACLALPLDTHWLFQCELASSVAAQFGHSDLWVYFGIF